MKAPRVPEVTVGVLPCIKSAASAGLMMLRSPWAVLLIDDRYCALSVADERAVWYCSKQALLAGGEVPRALALAGSSILRWAQDASGNVARAKQT